MNDMAAVLVVKNGKLLVIHNTKCELRVEPPGGKRKDYETIEECAKREFFEETGINPNLVSLFGMYSTTSPEGEFNVYMYLAGINGNVNVMEPSKHSKLEWCSYDNLLKLKEQGVLVPNLCSALDELKVYLK